MFITLLIIISNFRDIWFDHPTFYHLQFNKSVAIDSIIIKIVVFFD